jgi:ketosteroid isomerase-like protein
MRLFIGNAGLMLALLVFSSLAWAGQDGRKDDREMLLALKEKVVDAINKRDYRALASYGTREFAVTTIDQTRLSSPSDMENYFNKVFNSPDSTVTTLKVASVEEIQIRFIDADNVYCYGKTHDFYTMKDLRMVPIDSRWTAMLHREKGEWKIAALHAGVNFKDNAVLTRSDNAAKLALLVGFGAGVVLTIVCYGILFIRKTAKN